MVAHKPVAWLAVGAQSLGVFVARDLSGGHLTAEVRVFAQLHYPPRLRLGASQQRAHHRRAEKDWSLFHFTHNPNSLMKSQKKAAAIATARV